MRWYALSLPARRTYGSTKTGNGATVLMSPLAVAGPSPRIRVGFGSRVTGPMETGVTGGFPVIGHAAKSNDGALLTYERHLDHWSKSLATAGLLYYLPSSWTDRRSVGQRPNISALQEMR